MTRIKKLISFISLLATVWAAIKKFRDRKSTDYQEPAPFSPREEQPEVVEEWGEESFPASDPPQSW